MKTFDHSLLSANGKPDCAGCHATPGNQLHQHLTPNTCANCHNTDRWETESFDHKLLPADLINDCSSCHKAPADDLHQQLSGSCQTCHTYTAWKPSTFQHEKYFVFDKHHTSTCKNCHLTRDLKEYTCTNCHEHNLSELIPEHREEGIQTNIEKCAKCHKSSNEDDIRYNQENNSIKEQDVNKIKKYVNENDKENSGKDDD
jgi:hypothetical protein